MKTSVIAACVEFPHFDPSVLARLYGGSENPIAVQVFEASAKLMLTNIEQRMGKLKASLAEKSSTKIKEHSHVLRGSVFATGGARAAAICHYLENHCEGLSHSESEVEFDLAWELLSESCSVFRSELDVFLTQIKKAGSRPDLKMNL